MRNTLPQVLAAVLCTAAAVAHAQNCVSSIPQANPDGVYIQSGDGTVTDTRTGLMWKQCLEGYEGDQCATPNGTAAFSWQGALDHAVQHTFAGHADWRVPDIKELRSLVEECKVTPAINNGVFKGSLYEMAWSGSPHAGAGSDMAWAIYFYTGFSMKKNRTTDSIAVRLVRGGYSYAPLPVLADVQMSGPATASGAAFSATSNVDAAAYWVVVDAGAVAPTPFQVKSQADYGGVAVRAAGIAAGQSVMANSPASFTVSGLGAGAGYDLYLVAYNAHGFGSAAQKVPFTTAALPGACGSAHNPGVAPLLADMPAGNLCDAGAPSSVAGGTTAWNWTCSGSSAATCQAPRGYTVTPTAGAGGGISPATAQTVAYGATPAFTVTPDAGHAVASVTGCGGALAGSTFTTGAVTAACTVNATFAPLTHAVTATASPVAGGSAVCSGSVNQGATATCTATASAGYQFHGWTGACAGQGAVCSLANVTASQASVALFTQQPAGLTLPEGPYIGQTLGLALQPGNGWQVTQAGTETVASLSAPALPPGVTLPHGVVRLELRHGTQASTATVVLTYPQALPAGAAYYKYGKTRGDATPHWYAFPGAAISGNTVTLTLKDGWAGDGDVTENGVIQDPGGVALVAASPAATAAAIPTLGEWALALLAGALGLFSLGALRRRQVARG